MTDRPASRGRRRVLLGLVGASVGAAASGALGACSAVDPSVRGAGTPAPVEPPPTPVPTLAGSQQAAARETALAAQATGLADRSRITAAVRGRLEQVAAGHRVHAVALAAPQPTRRPTAPPTPEPGATATSPSAPSTTLPRLPSGTDDALDLLGDQLLTAATSYAATAVRATGSTALLWGSLAVSAQMAADAIGQTTSVTAPRAVPPVGLPQVTDVAAAQQLLAQVHAIVWGYRAALAALSGAQRDRAAADLRTRMITRDALDAWLTQRKQKVPVAEPAYAVPVEPSTADRAARLIMTMETALLPFAGQWVAACDEPSRSAALTGLTSSGRASVRWGGPPRTWPGWPD